MPKLEVLLRGVARDGLKAAREAANRAQADAEKAHRAALEWAERRTRELFKGRMKELADRRAVVVLAEQAARAARSEMMSVGKRLVSGAREELLDAAQKAADVFGRVGVRVPLERVSLSGAIATRDLEVLRARAAAHAAQLAAMSVRSQVAIADVSGMTVERAIRQALRTYDANDWRVYRVARTEANHAFNAGQDAALLHAFREGSGPIWKRWTELVDDATGRPKDSRVAQDSIAMHGQVTVQGGVFTQPGGKGVPSRLVGRSWAHPPNRPHDRAVLTPWWPGCGVPGWDFSGGVRRLVG